MGRYETPLPDSCGDCLLFNLCRKNSPVYNVKGGGINTEQRGSSDCLTNFSPDGSLLVGIESTPTAPSPEAVSLHRLPPGLVGSRRPGR